MSEINCKNGELLNKLAGLWAKADKREGDERMNEKDLKEWTKFVKRCINCDAYGYKTANDWKYGQRYCFVHKVYINKPDQLVCKKWLPMD